MNYKKILIITKKIFITLLISSNINLCFGIDIDDNDFLQLCEATVVSGQKHSAAILKIKLKQSNYLHTLRWLCNTEYEGLHPINYVIEKNNPFMLKTMIDYISNNPNEQKPFNYTNGDISNHKVVALVSNKDRNFIQLFLNACSFGSIELIELIYNFYSDHINKDHLLEGLCCAKRYNNDVVAYAICDYLAVK